MAAPPELERVYDDHAQALFALLLNFTRNQADTHDLEVDDGGVPSKDWVWDESKP